MMALGWDWTMGPARGWRRRRIWLMRTGSAAGPGFQVRWPAVGCRVPPANHDGPGDMSKVRSQRNELRHKELSEFWRWYFSTY